MTSSFSSDHKECSLNNLYTILFPVFHFPLLIFRHVLLREERSPLFFWTLKLAYHNLSHLKRRVIKHSYYHQLGKKQSYTLSMSSYKYCDKVTCTTETFIRNFEALYYINSFNQRNPKILIQIFTHLSYTWTNNSIFLI